MRRPTELSAQVPEELGKQIAGEFSGFFQEEEARRRAEEEDRHWSQETLEVLKMAIHRTVDGYNDHAPPKFWLALVDRGDHMVFNFSAVTTVTLTWKPHQMILQSHSGEERYALPLTFDVILTESGIALQILGDSPVFRTGMIPKNEFMCSLLRFVCRDFLAGAFHQTQHPPGPTVGVVKTTGNSALDESGSTFSPPGERSRTAPGGDAVTCRSWQRFLSPSFRRSWRPGSTN